MKSVIARNAGGPDALTLEERPVPVPSAQEVLIEVHAAGVNRPDCLQRQGKYPLPPGTTDILGLEVAGKISACGKDVTRWKVGDTVCALVVGGGYAEFVAVPEGQCLPLPQSYDFVRAAALPENIFTVFTNLIEDGELRAGESVLIHGGSGGIGLTAIQMAHVWGAKVFTTVGKQESVALCSSLGADHVILYKSEDFVSAVRAHAGEKGVDVILDMIAGPYFAKNISLLAARGRLVHIATQQGAKVELDLAALMQKRGVVTGSILRPRSVVEKSRIARCVEEKVWPLLSAGKLSPQIARTFALEEVRQAHELMESGNLVGKIVLSIKPGT